jgi:hypothetical protein
MTHQVALALYRASMHAWVLDLPGCVAGARDEGDLGEKLPLSIAEHKAWLRRHGQAVDGSEEWEIVERLDVGSMSREFCFEADRGELSRDELERGIERMSNSRADLVASVDGLPDTVRDWAPPASAYKSFDAWAPEVRTIREIVTHVLQLEVYYRDGLRDGPSAGIFERVDDLTLERQRTFEMLRALDDDARARSYWPVRPARDEAEEWTVQKVIRRIVSHERMHVAEIAQRLAWLQLGVPEVRGG